jgi:hypothetical protein
VRLIVARCEVGYAGRLDALLPEALRLIMVKSDGSVMVHADTGGNKPQNWNLFKPASGKAKLSILPMRPRGSALLLTTPRHCGLLPPADG